MWTQPQFDPTGHWAAPLKLLGWGVMCSWLTLKALLKGTSVVVMKEKWVFCTFFPIFSAEWAEYYNILEYTTFVSF